MLVLLLLQTHVSLALAVTGIDTAIADWFRAHLGPSLAIVLWSMSQPASGWWVGSVVVVASIYMIWKRHWHTLVMLALTVPCGALLGETLKLIVQRPRPFIGGPFGEWGGFSFPSGHTTAATLLYGFISLLLVRALKAMHLRIISITAAAFVIVGVGFSRVALGAHYLTDVIGAMVISLSWIALCSTSIAAFGQRRKPLAEPIETAIPPQQIEAPIS